MTTDSALAHTGRNFALALALGSVASLVVSVVLLLSLFDRQAHRHLASSVVGRLQMSLMHIEADADNSRQNVLSSDKRSLIETQIRLLNSALQKVGNSDLSGSMSGGALALQLEGRWNRLAGQLEAVTNSPAATTSIAASPDQSALDSVHTNPILKNLTASFDDVFADVTQSSFSAALLRNLGETSAVIKQLEFFDRQLASAKASGDRVLVDAVASALAELQQLSKKLQDLSIDKSGKSLFGYNTRQLLELYHRQVAELKPGDIIVVLTTTNNDVKKVPELSSSTDDRLRPLFLQLSLELAKARNAIDTAEKKNHRTLFNAMLFIALGLLLSLLCAWCFIRQSKRWSTTLANQVSDTEIAIAELTHVHADLATIANGHLQQTDTQRESPFPDSLRHIVKMMQGLVSTISGVAVKVSVVAAEQNRLAGQTACSSQQHISKTDDLVEKLANTAQGLRQLNVSLRQRVSAHDKSAEATQSAAAAVNLNRGHQPATAQIELQLADCQKALVSLRTNAELLKPVVHGVSQAAERCRLIVLNSSLRKVSPDSTEEEMITDDLGEVESQLRASTKRLGAITAVMLKVSNASSKALASISDIPSTAELSGGHREELPELPAEPSHDENSARISAGLQLEELDQYIDVVSNAIDQIKEIKSLALAVESQSKQTEAVNSQLETLSKNMQNSVSSFHWSEHDNAASGS